MTPPASPPADIGGNPERGDPRQVVLYTDRHLHVTWSPLDSSVVLSGEVDVSNSAALASALARVRDPDRGIVVDAAELRFIDLSGLRALLHPSLRQSGPGGGPGGEGVRLRNVPPYLERLLRLLDGSECR
ncbi:STAS domain-containing protein [Sphaerimonospora cavernae]|uniref:STAS domain-containing protein n=1 Tax=Sphaerimonospora cavernae TaxID=1740611 RepID=A0ABV6U8H9_9ACTN